MPTSHTKGRTAIPVAAALLGCVLAFAPMARADDAAPAPAPQQTAAPAGLAVDGTVVDHPLMLTIAALKAMPSVTIPLTFATEHGPVKATWTGVPLWALIEQAGVGSGPKADRFRLRHVLMASAPDGYTVAFSLGELDPDFGGAQAIVAYARDDQPLPNGGVRLVVATDKKGGRNVQNLSHLEIH